jgi:predicted alpha-1,6-mannanase (GH76 family)
VVSWSDRAAAAEQAIVTRNLRGLWWLGDASLGLAHWPPTPADRLFLDWHYWWQAHLLHTLAEAYLREPSETRSQRVAAVLRGIHVRNWGRWLNRYYDDIAWLGIACQRARTYAGVPTEAIVEAVGARLRSGWSAEGGGGIYWRRCNWFYRLVERCDFKATPADGSAAVFFAGQPHGRHFAAALLDWLEEELLDARTGLLIDGVYVDSGELARAVYTYNQGVYLGACARLYADTAEARWRGRAERTVVAVRDRLARASEYGPVLRGQGGGDGGLFAGILARHLARAALLLGDETAAGLVRSSAESAWANAARAEGGVLFGPDWAEPARVPSRWSSWAERDLSTQVSGWMLIEAAALLERAGPPLP